MNKIYNDYDGFAYFYNKYWTERPQKLMAQALEVLLVSSLKKGSAVLDLCCGTGNIAAFLCSKGYKITGIDGASGMLQYAEINAPQARFICADARDFSLDDKFDAVLCLFDSVNHFLETVDVEKVFSNAAQVLKKGGIFIFDANSLQSASTADDMDFSAVGENEVFIMKASFEKTTGLTSYSATSFIKEEGAWQRRDDIIYEKYHGIECFIGALKKAGFTDIAFADGANLGIKDFKNRLFFTAKKL